MIQSSKNISSHIPFLDSLRGFAILMVVLSHIYGLSFGFYHLGWNGMFPDLNIGRSALLLVPLTYGNMGVPIFFVISGFCIHMSHLRSRETGFRNFFARRFFRIYPAYFVALIFFAFAYRFYSSPPMSIPGWKNFLLHTLLLHNISQKTLFSINPSFWSLAIEFQLYLLYPLVFVLAEKQGWKRTLLILAFIECIIRIIPPFLNSTPLQHLFFFLNNSSFAYWFSWSIGAVIADAYFKKKTLPFLNQPLSLWVLMWVISISIARFACLSPTIFSICTAIYMARLLDRHSKSPETQQPKLINVWLSHLGIISYSLYLFHQPLLTIAPKITQLLFQREVHSLITFTFALLTLPMITAVSWLSYKYIELPSITLGKRFSQRFKAKTT